MLNKILYDSKLKGNRAILPKFEVILKIEEEKV
jgi:hypothetical protein